MSADTKGFLEEPFDEKQVKRLFTYLDGLHIEDIQTLFKEVNSNDQLDYDIYKEYRLEILNQLKPLIIEANQYIMNFDQFLKEHKELPTLYKQYYYINMYEDFVWVVEYDENTKESTTKEEFIDKYKNYLEELKEPIDF